MKVSVCIPAYNRPDLLKRCLDSVLMQDYKNYEIIISDDSSDDAIKNFIKSLNDPRISYCHNSPALGSPENWNRAMDMAKGEYVKFMHHDDYFTCPESLRLFVETLDESNASFAFSHSRIISRAQNTTFIHKQNSVQLRRLKRDPEFLFYRNVIGAPSAVIFKNEKEFRFDKNYRWLVDVDFYIRLLRKRNDFKVIEKDLVTVVAGEEGQITGEITSDKKAVIAENVHLFLKLKLPHTNKAMLFFEELFDEYGVVNFSQLEQLVSINSDQKAFFENVFLRKNKNVLGKKILRRLLTSRYNKRIFKIERF